MAALVMTGCRERNPVFAVVTPGTLFTITPCRYRVSSRVSRFLYHCLVSMVLAVLLVLSGFSSVSGSSKQMKGPGMSHHRHISSHEAETSVPRIVLFGALTLFQKYISPVDGDRCGFTPTCSAFAREAVGRLGAVQGVQVTADRLMRCSIFKGPSPDYMPLPTGKLFDPLENNLLSNP
jgi:uncharacterized protein